ncbi:Uncharacterized conserved protein YndB, AHSA1/START domain [Paenibacillus sp. UNCCL117]|uniref:SRPBCC family protein n=1 Tax=unclassified Paenibacillus TaxID=185978 RepID=UPI0008913780|nr:MULTISPECIES: SRPBCC family protein [unclassified Paenibacillus]SDD93037.1 Uncharacterized conserved protein YndB, AHSA1/START domain [Paenibacillus sp. cl123]SFW43322.1 Uncharacterized conserved protein YndB, AHSA1/START domain [Paenibacillus sp. UNCCL117]
MLAVVNRTDTGYVACFERRFNHPAEAVWSMLTENEQLARWFPELRAADLREGGRMTFDMQDGTFEDMTITAYKPLSVLEYAWGEDQVRFELQAEAAGCRLLLIEQIDRITDHTSKDLAGWHVCLDVIEALLDRRTLESREDEWKTRHPQYEQLLGYFR